MRGGAVSVTSELGLGSTFTVSIPLAHRAASSDSAPAPAEITATSAPFFGDEARRWLPRPRAAPAPRAGRAGRVLIADDNADMLAYVTRILGDQGFSVEAFADGASALAAALAAPPDLVLTDVMMPGLDGIELLQALRADDCTSAVPVVILSARAGDDARVDGFVAGADDYLVKPFSARELCARTASLVELSRLRREAVQERDVLRRSEAALVEAAERKEEFLAVLGHELRNPLAPIRLAVQLLDGHVPHGERGRRYLEILDRQMATLTRLVEDLLDVARITRGAIPLRRERLDVEALVRRAMATVQPLFEERRHRVAFAASAEPLFVHGDPVRLEQVVVNLLTNAARYTDPGGRVAVATEHDDGYARLRVRDWGVGIAPEMLGRIFDPFAQGARDPSRTPGGLGTGLAVVKGLVEQHGGTVTAESDGVGAGAELVVRLPLVGAPSVDPSGPVPLVPRSAGRPRRVLVVDDNQHAAETLRHLLADAGHAVNVANDGLTALRLAAAHSHDVVLLDLRLPGMDGFEVARRLRRSGTAGRALVAVAGYGGSEYRARTQAAGFDAHMVKPITMDALSSILAGAESVYAAET